jgi:hypothetical protein
MNRWLALSGSPFLVRFVALTGLATVWLFAKLVTIDQQLAPYGIVPFEFAGSPEGARPMLAKWSEPLPPDEQTTQATTGLEAARQSLVFDFPFLVAYAAFLSSLVLLAYRAAPAALARLGAWLSLAPFAAAGLDILENIALLRVLQHPQAPPPLPLRLAAVAAGVKFALVIGAALYAVGIGLYRLARRRRYAPGT